MELSDLKAFLLVVQTGSMSKAARELHLTQPALSKKLKKLEEELSVRLLERRNQGCSPTPAGRVLCHHAEQMKALDEACRRVMGAFQTEISGEIIIGTGTTGTMTILPSLISSFWEKYPEVRLSIVVARTDELVSLVLKGEVDLGLVGKEVYHSGIEVIPFAEDEILLVASPRHPLNGVKHLGTERLAAERFVLFAPRTGLRAYIDRILSRLGIEPEIAMESDNIAVIKCMVEAGLGVAFAPYSAVKNDLAAGTLVRLPMVNQGETKRLIAVMAAKNRYMTPAMQELLQMLLGKNRVKDLTKRFSPPSAGF